MYAMLFTIIKEIPYENYVMITAKVLLHIEKNFVFLLEYYSTRKMIKLPRGNLVEVTAGKFVKLIKLMTENRAGKQSSKDSNIIDS